MAGVGGKHELALDTVALARTALSAFAGVLLSTKCLQLWCWRVLVREAWQNVEAGERDGEHCTVKRLVTYYATLV